MLPSNKQTAPIDMSELIAEVLYNLMLRMLFGLYDVNGFLRGSGKVWFLGFNNMQSGATKSPS